MLLDAALHCYTLLYATLRCSTLLYVALRCSTLLYAALRCSTLLYTALHCSTLLYAALRCSTLLYAALLGWLVDKCYCNYYYFYPRWYVHTTPQGVYIIRWDFNEGFLFHVAHRKYLPLDGARIR
jgi:hypothetical protein